MDSKPNVVGIVCDHHHVAEPLSKPKEWQYRRVISEHAFDKLRAIDCTFAEFALAIERARVIEEESLEEGQLKELLLVEGWTRPLHVVCVVDLGREEERLITVYEPDPHQWSADYRRRR